MKKKRTLFKTIIPILLILIAAFIFIKKKLSNDLFFDLKTGEDILKYGVDFKDHFSFIPNLTYLYHHWLYDLIVFGIYKAFNWNGIFIIFLVAFSLFGISLFVINKEYSNKLIALLITIFTMYISAYAFQFRVQSITYVLFIWQIYILEKLYKTGKKKYSIFLLLIAILIVNLHMPLWIFCLILYLPFLAETLLCVISKKIKRIKNNTFLVDPKNTKLILITFLILIFTGLCSPLKLHPYTFFTKSLFNDSFSAILEMAKTVLYYRKWALLLLLIVILGINFRVLKFTVRDLFLTIGLFLFSLIASRNVIFFYMIIPTICIKSFSKKYHFAINNKITNIIKKINFNVISIFLIILLSLAYIITVISFFHKKPTYNETYDLPDKSINYILSTGNYKNIHLYTEFDFGSYVAFKDIPIFIDSRAEVYIKEFNGGYDIIGDWKKANNFNTYKEILNKYNFDYLIVYYNSDLDYLLKEDKDYTLVYTEMDGVMYSLYQKNDN